MEESLGHKFGSLLLSEELGISLTASTYAGPHKLFCVSTETGTHYTFNSFESCGWYRQRLFQGHTLITAGPQNSNDASHLLVLSKETCVYHDLINES